MCFVIQIWQNTWKKSNMKTFLYKFLNIRQVANIFPLQIGFIIADTVNTNQNFIKIIVKPLLNKS